MIIGLIKLKNNADREGGFLSGGKLTQDYKMKIIWKSGFIKMVLAVGIIWMLLILGVFLFHIWTCQSSVAVFSGTDVDFFPLFDHTAGFHSKVLIFL